MKSQAHEFPVRATQALLDEDLRRALNTLKGGLLEKRRVAFEQLPEHDPIRNRAREIKDHTLAHLDYYLEQFETNVKQNGGHVHWASTPDEAADIVVEICREAGAKRVIPLEVSGAFHSPLMQPAAVRMRAGTARAAAIRVLRSVMGDSRK